MEVLTKTKTSFVTAFSPEVTTVKEPISQVKFSNLPELQDGLPEGMQRIIIPSGHLLTPHLHPDSNETTVCLKGSGIVGIIEPDPTKDNPIGTAIVEYSFNENNVVFLPQGYPHYFRNTADKDGENMELLLTFENYNFNIITIADVLNDLPKIVTDAVNKSVPNSGHAPLIPFKNTVG